MNDACPRVNFERTGFMWWFLGGFSLGTLNKIKPNRVGSLGTNNKVVEIKKSNIR